MAFSLSSEYLSFLFFQMAPMTPKISSSVDPFLISVFKSCPFWEKRQVTNFPSAVSLARVQLEQKGSVTDAITPMSPLPSENR
jgi:hypothetical protein